MPSAVARAAESTSIDCHGTLCERRSAKWSSPAPTVWFVIRSMRMKPPVSRFSTYGSKAIGSLSSRLTTPIAFSSSSFAAMRSSVSTSSLYFSGATVAATVFVPDAHEIRAAAEERLVRHPHDRRLELVADLRRRVGSGEHVAAADVDLVRERQRHRLPGDGALEVALERDDARDGRLLAAREHDDAVARPDRAAGDRAGEAAEVGARPVHPLHGQAERRVLHPLLVDLDRLEVAP